MAVLKTKENDKSVDRFLKAVKDETKREECYTILDWMKKATRKEPKMWGDKIVGFGAYHYKYESGREGDWFLIGFSPRKTNISLHLMPGFAKHEDLLADLGKYKTGAGCLYVKSLDDVDPMTLKKLIKKSYVEMKKMYPEHK